jgi:PAS domain S-box-containing protein
MTDDPTTASASMKPVVISLVLALTFCICGLTVPNVVAQEKVLQAIVDGGTEQTPPHSIDSSTDQVTGFSFDIVNAIASRLDDAALSQKLDAALNDLAGSDDFQNIHGKWFGAPEPFWSRDRILLIIGAGLLAILGVFFAMHYFSMHGQYRNLVKSKDDRERFDSALLNAERRYRGTFEHAGIGLANVSTDGRFLAVNDRFSEIVGYVSEELLKKTFAEITHSDDAGGSMAAAKDMIAGKIDKYVAEKRYVRADKLVIWARVTSVLLKNADGSPDYFVTAIEDISKRRDAETALLQAQKIQAIGQLTGGIAHDFNNLMAIMMGNAELLEDYIGDNEEAIDLLERIINAVQSGASLTQRLLAFSRQQPLVSRHTDIEKQIQGMQELLQRTLGGQVTLNVSGTASPWQVMIDPSQFEHALINLALNANDAMPKGGVLSISFENTELTEDDIQSAPDVIPGDYVLIRVQDSGEGMSEALQEKVLEPFFTTKDVGQGSGLGLSMVYGFVKQSLGHLTLDSNPGEGTTIGIYLPRAQPEDSISVNPDLPLDSAML